MKFRYSHRHAGGLTTRPASWAFLLSSALLLTQCGVRAAPRNGGQPKSESLSRQRVLRWIAEKTGGSDTRLYAELLHPLSDASVARLFPGIAFQSLVFPMYPVARAAPEPLKSQNLFAVSRDGSVRHLPDPEALRGYFEAASSPRTAGRSAWMKDLIRGWLRLTQEYSADGYFRFEEDPAATKLEKAGSGWRAVGRARVAPRGGDRGEIRATITVDAQGKVHVSETRNVQAGVRPVCQATRLLDPDPLVRRMAEQDLLVMGITARSYLRERRLEAAPDLRREIDRVWKRIAERERVFSGARVPTLTAP